MHCNRTETHQRHRGRLWSTRTGLTQAMVWQKKKHSRKSAVFYWSILQFGMHALSKEQTWFTLTMCRQHDCIKLDSQVAQITSRALRRFHLPGRDVRINGVTLEFATGESVTIFLDIGVILADEPALKEMLECKGHAGLLVVLRVRMPLSTDNWENKSHSGSLTRIL